jgi:C4-type Zn-finger protein
MQTLFIILILFLISIFSVLLYFKTKVNRLDLLNSGECPTCKQKRKTFFDKKTNTTFTSEVISSRVLKNHGCSGVIEVEYSCKNCGLKEVHSINSSSNCGV